MTIELFREDGYLKSCKATITAVLGSAICVDQSVFYPHGGGQPGDIGILTRENGDQLKILDCYKDRERNQQLHVIKANSILPEVGESVTLEIDWERRHRLMRMHSCMHMLCAAVPAAVTGGSIRDGSGRLDFDLPNPPTREALEQKLNEIIQGNHPMTLSWITDEEMEQQPELIRTMSVLPPMGSGKVRLVKFGDVDLQPCGGTHVENSSEIGQICVESIKNKGKQNRRITVKFLESE